MRMFRRLINAVVDIVYPATCISCKKNLKGRPLNNDFLCAECLGKIKKNLPPFCHRCGRHLESNRSLKNICAGCVRKQLHFDRAFSPCQYEGVIKDLIHDFKYKNKYYLGPILSGLMIEFIKEYNLPIEVIDFLIPVPLHAARMREREFNQAQVLSDQIAVEFNKAVQNDNLKRFRHTRTQTELKDDLRFLNVKDSFSLTRKEEIKGKNILLIDDVLTTGATASEAAFILKDAGANIVFVLTAAN
jgi:competence protein ComFC